MHRWRWRPCNARRGCGDLGCRIHGRARQVSLCLYELVERFKEEGGDTLKDALWTQCVVMTLMPRDLTLSKVLTMTSFGSQAPSKAKHN